VSMDLCMSVLQEKPSVFFPVRGASPPISQVFFRLFSTATTVLSMFAYKEDERPFTSLF